ncbi:MAG: hypoxanthine phosphoribosyltransferase [Planctomycetes bacterium]|nr:hypoxanthine phosphoribosyltransferase [Planctomycetota bacterium]
MTVLIDSVLLHRRVDELAAEINRDYDGKNLILVGLLKGSFVFLADLIRKLTIDFEIDFMSIAGYGNLTEHSGAVRLLKDLNVNISGRPVLIVEDIVDSGLTIDYIRRMLLARQPADLAIMTLLDKRIRREVDVPIEYVGFEIDDTFVIGYGLDLAERYRGLDYIATVDISHEQNG